jgi:hypothetical protein
MEKPSLANDRARLCVSQGAVVRWKINSQLGLTQVVDDFAGGVRARCAG